MKILVVGSYIPDNDKRWLLSGSLDGFMITCAEIGEVIAECGHELIIQCDKPTDADLHVANGYLNYAQKHHGKPFTVTVVRPAQVSRRYFEEYTNKHPSIFSHKHMGTRKWDAARFRACLNADYVILIGGGSRTELTGYFALAAGRKILPIGSFGGAAEALISEPAGPGKINAVAFGENLLSKAWSPNHTMALRKLLAGEFGNPQIVIVHGRDHNAVKDLIAHIAVTLKLPSPTVMGLDIDQPGSTLPEKWETVAATADGAIVLATPDDKGRLAEAGKLRSRARQNVWLEYGWFWGRFNSRSRLLLLIKRDLGTTLELPTDITGIEYHIWDKSPTECAAVIDSFLRSVRASMATN